MIPYLIYGLLRKDCFNDPSIEVRHQRYLTDLLKPTSVYVVI